MIFVKAQGKGLSHMCSIWAWILDFVWEEMLPLHFYSYTQTKVLENGKVLQEVQRELLKQAKVGFVEAEDDAQHTVQHRLMHLTLLSVFKMYQVLSELRKCLCKTRIFTVP